jgi:hypothetical protein
MSILNITQENSAAKRARRSKAAQKAAKTRRDIALVESKCRVDSARDAVRQNPSNENVEKLNAVVDDFRAALHECMDGEIEAAVTNLRML